MKKFVNLYLFSYILLAAGFVLFIQFIRVKDILFFIIFSAVFIAFSVLYRISTKKITFEEGYNLLQAISFYVECKSIKTNDRETDKENMRKIASKYEYARNLSSKELDKMYQAGHKYEKLITNPLIKLYIKKKEKK